MIQEIDTLYKRGRDSILEWKVKIETRNMRVNIVMSYGIYDGEKAIRWQNDIKGKNKGKVNETNSWEQAELEAISKATNKKRQGYKSLASLIEDNQDLYYQLNDTKLFLEQVLPAFNTDINGNEIPMKCQQYYRSKAKWTAPDGKVYDDRKHYYLLNPNVAKEKNAIITEFPCFIQPKINGVRAFVKLVKGRAKLFSKKGLEYNLPHITDWFNANLEMFDIEDNIIFDGELYIPDTSLQNIVSAVKAYQIASLDVKYYIFDVAIEDVPQDQRFRDLLYTEKVKQMINNSLDSPVNLVSTRTVKDDASVQKLTNFYIAEGYEGSICRDFKGLYEFGKRPKTITKLKRIMDEEFIICDVVASEKDPTMGIFVCKTEQGREFKVNPKGTEAYKREVLYNSPSFIGKQLTCHFYEYTDDLIPFHVVDNVVRDYE